MDQVLELAIAASARSWPDRLHRHVLDHGGAIVTGRVLGATQAVDTGYDVLLIDDVCSFLSPGLISALREAGRQVLGVYDRDDGPDAKRRLLECGISDVIESDASADEFLAQASTVAETVVPSWPRSRDESSSRTIGVVGVTAGVGATEVAVGLAWSLSRQVDTVLVDVDPALPSVAQRLDLAPHPNLLTLIDGVVHGYSHDEAETRCDRLRVVPGVALPGQQSIPRHEVEMAIEALSGSCDVLVADLGDAAHNGDGTLGKFDTLVVVVGGDPVGVTRLVRDSQRWLRLAEASSLVVVVNRCPPRRFQRSELGSEIEQVLGSLPLITLPHDDRVMTGAWEGSAVAKGRFGRRMGSMAGIVASAVNR